MLCIDMTTVIDVCDEYLCTNKIVVHVVVVTVTTYMSTTAGMYTDSLVSLNSKYVIQFIVEINFTHLLFYI